MQKGETTHYVDFRVKLHNADAVDQFSEDPGACAGLLVNALEKALPGLSAGLDFTVDVDTWGMVSPLVHGTKRERRRSGLS